MKENFSLTFRLFRLKRFIKIVFWKMSHFLFPLSRPILYVHYTNWHILTMVWSMESQPGLGSQRIRRCAPITRYPVSQPLSKPLLALVLGLSQLVWFFFSSNPVTKLFQKSQAVSLWRDEHHHINARAYNVIRF